MKLTAALLFLTLVFYTPFANACSPCGGLSNITQNNTGSTLELTFTSNAGWECCYTVQIEIICENEVFTGVPNYFSQEICINGGSGFSTPYSGTWDYPLTVIDISNFCPGNYQWRAVETGCGVYTSVYNFSVTGNFNPLTVTATQDKDTICGGDAVQFDAVAQDGCNGGPYSYSWSPTTGLSNPNIANPIATPATTTTYTLTVTENGFCTAPATADMTVVVSPQPTATIDGTVTICDGDDPPIITFTGANGTAPYTIEYTLNGVAQTAIVTNGNSATIPAVNSPPGTYTYSITNITEGSANQCTNDEISSAIVTINPLPNVEAGEDQIICDIDPANPTVVTLSGSGAVSYTWDNGVTDGVPFNPPYGSVTTYTVTGTDANGCQNTDVVTVESQILPVANGTADPIYGNAPLPVNFTNTSTNASNYFWDFGDGNSESTTGLVGVSNTYTEPGIYEVVLTASNGICETYWTIEIEVIPPMIVTPPNVFTPDGDQINDFYWVDVQWGEFFEAVITNRWGNVLKELDAINQTWDGTFNGSPVSEGVYFIRYKATDFNGLSEEGHTFFHIER